VIQLTILDGTMPTAAEAVRNLRRLIRSISTRRRKRQAPTSLTPLTDMYSNTLVPIRIVNWTGEEEIISHLYRIDSLGEQRIHFSMFLSRNRFDIFISEAIAW
jgi:hypothetical protein